MLTHVELTLGGCSAQIGEIAPVSADFLADPHTQLPLLEPSVTLKAFLSA